MASAERCGNNDSMFRKIFLLLALIGSISHSLTARSAIPDWQTCADMQGKVSDAAELDCYRSASNAARQNTLLPLRPHGLAREWEPSNAPLNIYKQSYMLLYARSSQPNDMPTSPNPQNQVTSATPLDNRDFKFQFSIKHDLADFGNWGTLWFGYTQLSFWQLYDAANSRPFRENDYEPELIYSIRPDELLPELWPGPGIFNVGLVHQSNGQSDPRSRSWNRIYIQPGFEKDFGSDHKLIVLGRLWHRIAEQPANDNNPDITHYLGHGDLELRYSQRGNWEASLLVRKRSWQLDLSAPWTSWRWLVNAIPGEHNTNIHFQYFSGYGESLIDYNQRHSTWGLGLSFPFD